MTEEFSVAIVVMVMQEVSWDIIYSSDTRDLILPAVTATPEEGGNNLHRNAGRHLAWDRPNISEKLAMLLWV